MISDDVGSPGTIMAGIEVSPEALNEIKMTDEPMETTTAKWLSESEERAAQLFLQKIFHFSGPTGSTTTAQIGKSWPSASLQKGLVEQMKKWQEKRQYKFRSDLLFRWAKNLQEEEKLNISPNGKSTSRFLLRPCVGVLVEDVPESEFEGHFEGETEEADSSMEEKASTTNQPEKKSNKKEHRSQKKRKLVEPDAPKSNKRARREEGPKYTSEEGMIAVSNWRSRVHCDKERFEQVSSDIFHGTKEIGLIVNELLSQNQQAEITINELLRQMKELNARKESDWKLICSLREEVARLQKKQPWAKQSSLVGSPTNSDEEELSDGSLTDLNDRDYQLIPDYPNKLRRADDQMDQHSKLKTKYKPKQESKYQPHTQQLSPTTQQPKKHIQMPFPFEAPTQHMQTQSILSHGASPQYTPPQPVNTQPPVTTQPTGDDMLL